ncbi:MAG: HNH endonuclease signature motif containing protein [Leptolyngbyaceae bacterium]|nr:HNH endonuclease signature motif containing protein [Leptolyngbyaceae bacterium]
MSQQPRPYISQELRRLVATRAEHICEYCLIGESDTAFGCAVDHAISLKHGGTSDADNLVYACVFCNRYKGSDIGSILWTTREFLRFFNPRGDQWADHFQLDQAVIEPLTGIGQVTIQILGFNYPDRLQERQLLINRGQYPPKVAAKFLRKPNAAE